MDEVLAGQGLVADSPILPTTWAYDPGVRNYAYDPERAIGLLDASWLVGQRRRLVRDKEGVELAFTLLASDDPSMAQMAEELAGSGELWVWTLRSGRSADAASMLCETGTLTQR